MLLPLPPGKRLPQAAPGTSTAASCVFSRQERVGRRILHLSEALTSHRAPCSSPDYPLACPFESQRGDHDATRLICARPSCNPICNARYLSLAHPRHPYTTLLYNARCFWLAGRREALCWEEGRAARRPRGRCKPTQVLGCNGEQGRVQSGRAEHTGFVMGHRRKLRHNQTEHPGMLMLCPAISYGTFCFSWGLPWLGDDELRGVLSEYFILEAPSAKIALFTSSLVKKVPKSTATEVATPNQEKWKVTYRLYWGLTELLNLFQYLTFQYLTGQQN